MWGNIGKKGHQSSASWKVKVGKISGWRNIPQSLICRSADCIIDTLDNKILLYEWLLSLIASAQIKWISLILLIRFSILFIFKNLLKFDSVGVFVAILFITTVEGPGVVCGRQVKVCGRSGHSAVLASLTGGWQHTPPHTAPAICITTRQTLFLPSASEYLIAG